MPGSGERASGRLESAYGLALAELRDLDRDRYLACLLAPERVRHDLAVLYRFNAEIARLRDIVSEPLVGEMRLQWWRDVLAGDGERDAGGHPLAEALLDTIGRHDLPNSAFLTMLDARTFDLYDDPMPDRSGFETYAGETASRLLQLAAMVVDRSSATSMTDVAGHGGVAQAIAGTLLLMPIHSARGQVYVPGDLLAACGLDARQFLDTAEPAQVRAVVSALTAYGREHLALARSASAGQARSNAAFLPLALVDQVLARADRRTGADLRRDRLHVPQWRRQIRLARALLSGRF